jgi:trehalose 6-phosphate phosphatase
LELFTGKMVFEVRPPIGVDKGYAFRKLVKEHNIAAALFLGDDVSDLGALEMARQMREADECDAWGVGVQSEEAPEALAATADFLADGVPDVEALLDWLLMARKASST